jgi:hypothetical protein
MSALCGGFNRSTQMNVSQIYDGEGEPVEMKIELEGGPK